MPGGEFRRFSGLPATGPAAGPMSYIAQGKEPQAMPFKPKDFKVATQLPDNEAQAREWQTHNRAWWEENSMRYDWRTKIGFAAGTSDYFNEIDKRFFGAVQQFLPWRDRPFDNLIDFESLKDKDVLEIGVGQGSHAQLIAPHCRSYAGIDITETATKMTCRRLELNKIQAAIFQMDAENLSFHDASFDYIWSWGLSTIQQIPSKFCRKCIGF